MKPRLEFVLREIAGETLLVPCGKTALSLNGMLTLNAQGAEIWRLLPQAETEEEIVRTMRTEYPDVALERLRADISEFLEQLRRLGILG